MFLQVFGCIRGVAFGGRGVCLWREGVCIEGGVNGWGVGSAEILSTVNWWSIRILLECILVEACNCSMADEGFPRGAANPERGAKLYFLPKTASNEEN